MKGKPTMLPVDLDPRLLYSSTGEDKADDVNFAIGVRGSAPREVRDRIWSSLASWLTADRASELLACPCRVVLFPRLQAVNVLAVGKLRDAGFDKQGKGLGRALIERLEALRADA